MTMNDNECDRLWDAINKHTDMLSTVDKNVALIQQSAGNIEKGMEAADLRFQKHLEEHEARDLENRRTVKDVIMSLIAPALTGIGGGLAAVLGVEKYLGK